MIAASGVLFTLIINLVIAIAIPSIYGLENGISTMYTGSCDWTGKANTAIHLGVNLLSTLLLSGSNYCMQCLTAPTRAGIDNAHRNRQWLDIGVPSIRNLQAIGAKKLILWLALGLSSVPLHLLYNSVFFSAVTTYDYQVVWVTEGFLEGAPFNKTQWIDSFHPPNNALTGIQEGAATYNNLTNEECIRAYAQDFITTRRHVLLVVDTQDMPDPETEEEYYMFYYHPPDPETDSIVKQRFHSYGPLSPLIYFWICPRSLDEHGDSQQCRLNAPSLLTDIANGDAWKPEGYRVKYCLSEPYQESCTLQFSLSLLIVVIVCNAGKLAAMIATIQWLHSSRPLITVGDVVDSFMTRNDPFNKEMCLASLENFRKYTHHLPPIPFERQKKKCGQAASSRRWRTVLFL